MTLPDALSKELTANGMKRFLSWIIAISGLLLIAFVVRHFRSSGAATYQTATVTRGPITQAVTATGTLNPVVNVQVGSQVSGNISKLFVDFNSQVKAGQVVAQIDPALFQATVTQAEGDLASAQAALELARINAKRTQDLFARKTSSQADLDQAEAALHQAEANAKIKQGALDKAKADLEHCTITSPIDGVVISRSVDVGQTVAASLQAPVIFQIANDLTKMQIDSNVAEADVGVVKVGQDVDFTVDAFPTQTFHGKVVQVRNAPITVQNVVTYDTVIGVSNPDLKLKPGMTANVSIIAARKDNVLQIKNAALRYRPAEAPASETAPRPSSWHAERGTAGAGSGSAKAGGRDRTTSERTVYVLSGNQPKPVQIKTGISDGVVTEVIQGLKEGDRVVTAEIATRSQPASTPANPFSGARRFP
jgi:HlyD family secretion protein